MAHTQVTLAQLDNYGPWTVTPEPRREPDLQTLQASIYADLAQLVGSADGYAFFGRFDNMIAVTNGCTRADHERFQQSLGNRYPVSVSFGIGTGSTPASALADATAELQAEGSAQDGDRRSVLGGDPLAESDRTPTDVQIAHFDVVDATDKYTDRLDAYDAFLHVQRAYLSLAEELYERHGALAFFVGGDNVIAACPDLDESDYRETIAHVRDDVDVELQVGVGSGSVATDAGMAAKQALEICRDDGTRVEIAGAAVAGE